MSRNRPEFSDWGSELGGPAGQTDRAGCLAFLIRFLVGYGVFLTLWTLVGVSLAWVSRVGLALLGVERQPGWWGMGITVLAGLMALPGWWLAFRLGRAPEPR